VLELFAGVGGFHLALDRAGFDVVWSNQWEPGASTQWAFDCYEAHTKVDPHTRLNDFQREGRRAHGGPDRQLGLWEPPPHEAVNLDIRVVLEQAEAGSRWIPDADLVVGGFPCQDYSVARTLNQADGLVGKKGVLWWEIRRLLKLKRDAGAPIPFLFLENVDRLLKSPSTQRGRDFAVMLASLADLGYDVEWRVANAADYGFPQKRRRVFILGRRSRIDRPLDWMYRDGPLARSLPVIGPVRAGEPDPDFTLDGDLAQVSETFGTGRRTSPFHNGGVMSGRAVWTRTVQPSYRGRHWTLGSQLDATADIPDEYFVPQERVEAWQFLKGKKSLTRVNKAGYEYSYDEGAIPFPDNWDGPSRTILTGEGGVSASRFKHIIQTSDGRYRRLTPRELERLNGFPDDWTATGMPDGRRAFMMGNALVVGLVNRVADELIKDVLAASRVPLSVAVAS
jgi:DNA (cytosine-5)-methyltransferase 1